MTPPRRHPQTRLEEELTRLQCKLKLGHELTARWVPGGSSKLSGEVRDETIFVYEEDEEAAIETLKHEVIDFAMGQIIEPYKEVTNRLISMVNEDAYRRKEKMVDTLAGLL